MSHELRTPLNSIILLSKLLTNNQNNNLTPKDIEKTSVIHKAGNDLLLLINDILDLSKIESGNMELIYEDVQTGAILEEMKGLFGAVAEDKKIDFILNDLYQDSFQTDKVKLSQVLKNLLSNAFKFTKSGMVSIDIEEEHGQLLISVVDSGIGIPEDKLKTIFEAFKQVDGSISREFGGTGLGLSISKTIVDLMNGEIVVKSQEGKGTTFTIKLPLLKSTEVQTKLEQESMIEIPHAKSPELKPNFENSDSSVSIIKEEEIEEDYGGIFRGKNILIVDDDSRNIFTLTSTLESMDAEIFSAFNGKEAIEVLDEEEYIDLILMDVMMPVMDGLVAIKNIKASAYKDIPIIAITAKTMPEDKQKCLDVGADDYLPKPIEHSSLISMIKAWIK
jgi:two-component system chemotaxis sensor kinase CheA